MKKSALQIEKNPVILPRSSIISKRFAEDSHSQVKHGGRTSTIAQIRCSGVWIIGAGALVRKIVFYCVKCRKLRGKPSEQKMANLPMECFEAAGPFTHCGLDMFGPFTTILGRKSFKRYVALFLCLLSRAVHMEVTNECTAAIYHKKGYGSFDTL